jgi:hypothetical protein
MPVFRQRPRLRNAILGVALLLGQWLTLAHAIEHPALSPEQVCQICLHGQGLDSGAIAPTAVALPEFHAVAVDAPLLVAAVPLRHTARYRARAPPVVLV